jgi:DNA-binding MarR family transcriptional regulator
MSDEPRWLDPQEMDTWLALIGLAMRLPGALDGQLRRDADLNHFEYAVLATLEATEGHVMRMSELAGICNGSLSRLSHVARRLEEDGLIKRFTCPSDGRATNARLTDDGIARLAKAAPGHVDLVRSLVFDRLDPAEVERLGTVARRLLDGIEG